MNRLEIVSAPTVEELVAAEQNSDFTVHFVLRDENGTEFEATGGVELAIITEDLNQVVGDLLSTDWQTGANARRYAAWWLPDVTEGFFRFSD